MKEEIRDTLDYMAVLDALCDELRVALQAGQSSPIESLMQNAPAALKDRALVELVAEEVQLRVARGEQPQWEEYERRFPKQVESARKGFRSLKDADSEKKRPIGTNTEVGSQDTQPRKKKADTDRNVESLPKRLGNYQILAELGSGTFGRVLKALVQSNGQENIVAIKQLKHRWQTDLRIRQQFLDEAQRMMKLNHPGVVRVLELNDQIDPPFFVQEFVESGDLANRIRHEEISIQDSTEIAIQIADALAHVHSTKLYHRDLKPANVLIDEHGKIRIADFGLALADADRWQQPKAAAGTYLYMPPEQLRGEWELLQARSDLWSLGVIYYEMLTGERPFQQRELNRLRHEIASRVPPSPRDLNQDIPRRLNQLCMSCLEKEIRRRPTSAADFRDDLHDALNAGSTDSKSPATTIAMPQTRKHVYPLPNLKRFTAEQADLYLRLMPKSYANEEELPELIHFWKTRISCTDPDDTFRIGVLVGVSGCGKSSLLEAGLLPSLAQHIHPVMVQASEADTEVQLLKALQKRFPDAPPHADEWSLPEWTRNLRSGEILPEGHKVFLVLDQFEQWLHGHGDEPVSQLRDALQQCDGRHLQCLLCVREGFHSSLLRFTQSLDEHLDEERNYATAHRFNLGHARYVLEQFGRGLGRLIGELTKEQKVFLDRAVEELAKTDQDGVRSVRLVVLALVMTQREWSVDELETLGGLEGIGLQFLLDSFEGRTAPEQYRQLLPSAMRMLERLLPETGSELKDSRTCAELKQVSELSERDFDTLLNILVRKLFLVTPVNPDSRPADEETSLAGENPARYYQLTHDFLVPSIRQWIEVKEEQSPSGRASLLLRRLTGAWVVDRENRRHLPSLSEYLQIRRHSVKRRWSKPQHRFMRAATLQHMLRLCLFGLGVIVMGSIGIGGYYEAQASRLYSKLLSASPNRVTESRIQLSEFALRADPKLRPTADGNGTRTEILHAQIGLVARQPEYIKPLQSALLEDTLDFRYLQVISDAMVAANFDFTSELWELMRDEKESNSRRFRAGLVLAMYVGSDTTNPSEKWLRQDSEFLVEQFVSEDPENHKTIRTHLVKHRTALRRDLKNAFWSSQELSAEQQTATARAIAQFYRNDDAYLMSLMLYGTGPQFQELFPQIEINSELKTQLLNRIEKQPGDSMLMGQRILMGIARAAAAITLIQSGFQPDEIDKLFEVLRYDEDPEALSQFVYRCKSHGVNVDDILTLFYAVDSRRGPLTKQRRKIDDSVMYALLLALGEYELSDLPDARIELIKRLEEIYRLDPSSGVHSATGWLLRRWGQIEVVNQVDRTALAFDSSGHREWFVEEIEYSVKSNSLKSDSVAKVYFTFIVFQPGNFMIGARPTDLYKDELEDLQFRRITRTFAVADRETTWEQFGPFDNQNRFSNYVRSFKDRKRLPSKFKKRLSPGDPAFGVNWFECVAYCRWLTQQLGLPESMQCYGPEPLAKNTSTSENSIELPEETKWPVSIDKIGCRLCTETEWEFICRAGTHTPYSFGSDVRLIDRYAVFGNNDVDNLTSVTASLRPNPRGLFDVHGNVYEWCQDWYRNYRFDKSTDSTGGPFVGDPRKVKRGGCYGYPERYCRSAARYGFNPTYGNLKVGFRVARTCPVTGVVKSKTDRNGSERSN